jgi:hypothetical protein
MALVELDGRSNLPPQKVPVVNPSPERKVVVNNPPQINTGIESVNSVSEINVKIAELNNTITSYNKIIKDQTESIKTLKEVSISEDEDYVKKYLAEKKACLDRVDEYAMRKACNSSSFKHLYQAKLMKLILESIFLVDVGREIKKELDQDGTSKNAMGTDSYANRLNMELLKKHTFLEFKVNCFDAWKFKNIFLAKDDFITAKHIYYMDNNPLPPPEKKDGKEVINQSKEYRVEKYDKLISKVINTIDDAHEAIKDLRKEAAKFDDEKEYENVFGPLLDALQVMLFLKIVKTRLDCHKEDLAKVKFVIKSERENYARKK